MVDDTQTQATSTKDAEQDEAGEDRTEAGAVGRTDACGTQEARAQTAARMKDYRGYL
jgi:hypothetical protein